MCRKANKINKTKMFYYYYYVVVAVVVVIIIIVIFFFFRLEPSLFWFLFYIFGIPLVNKSASGIVTYISLFFH